MSIVKWFSSGQTETFLLLSKQGNSITLSFCAKNSKYFKGSNIMRFKKLLTFIMCVSVSVLTAAASLPVDVQAASGGFENAGSGFENASLSQGNDFEAVGDFGDGDGSPDLVMPGTGHFECPDLTFYDKIIFVGDSRTVQINDRVDDEQVDFVASSGQGLSWFKRSGVSKLNRLLASEEYTTPLPKAVIFNLGINDMENKNSYVSYLNDLAQELINQNCTLYYMSVNPVNNEIIQIPRSDRDIRDFNQAMKTKLDDFHYIDTYNYLKKDGFTTTDGLHYNSLTTQKIFNYVIEQINSRKASTKNVLWEHTGLYWYAYNPSTGDVYKNRWVSYEGGKFYVDRYGRMKTNSWITASSGNRYYVGASGRYYTSQWVLTNGKYYYLQDNGAMAKNQWIDGYYVGSDGARI